ncbi:Na+/H+ antiporter [Actinoplanes solisilvae]|uniref:Na+/H+ antiporter n=1 Tax=Actinoplanes solisilvae TaxID=2486853 RepID=UPI000FD9FE74|nr:Na+/H+ antiporter [Actinoplanes solisilvae]
MIALELVIAMGAALLAGNLLAARLRISTPVVLVFLGVVLGLIPQLRGVHLPPEVMLLLILPALLYWESLNTSLRLIRRNLRTITLMSTLLVFATAAVVATVAHALGLPWGCAWVLGGALAPTDATVVGAFGRSLPRRTVTVLKAESLINDGAALVIYGLAISTTMAGHRPGALRVTWLLILSYGGGLLVGFVVGRIAVAIRRRVADPMLENVTILLTPFTAFLLAELAGASGVIAAVVTGLLMSRYGPRVGHASTRVQTIGFWSLATFLLNGGLFVLIGIQVHEAVRGLDTEPLLRGILLVVMISAVLVATRFAWLFTTPYVIRFLDRRPAQRQRRVDARTRVVSGVAGFRGAVSLAAALAVPASFPDRHLVVFIVSGVIVVTLVTQAFIFGPVVRWAQLPPDTEFLEELRLAERVAALQAMDSLPALADQVRAEPAVVEEVRNELRAEIDGLRAGDDEAAGHIEDEYTALRLATIAGKRAAVIALRDQNRIDDLVVREMQSRLDREEVRLAGGPDPE